MTIQYKESSKYKLQADYYEQLILKCTFVEGNTVWFVHRINPLSDVVDCVHYKLDKKSNKLYKFNVAFSAWDLIENTLSEYTADDVWSKRTHQTYSYDGMNQGD